MHDEHLLENILWVLGNNVGAMNEFERKRPENTVPRRNLSILKRSILTNNIKINDIHQIKSETVMEVIASVAVNI